MNMEQLMLWSEEALANHSPSPGTARDWKELADSCGNMFEPYVISVQGYAFGRTSPEPYPPAQKARRGRISDACFEPWMVSGTVSHGEFWTRSFSESPSAAAVCFLSDVLERGGQRELAPYFLSRKACLGILRRAERRGKGLPPMLKEALERQGGAVAFAQNQRAEVRLMEIPGAIAANQGTYQTSNICMYHNPAVMTMHQNQCGDVHVSEEMAGTLTSGSSVSRQQLVVTNYGEDVAGTLTARYDSSPGMMGGRNVVCMSDTQPNTAISENLCGTLTSRQYKDPPVVAYE